MKPVVIFRHLATEGPGYFATFLEAHRIRWTLVAIDRNEPIPASAADYAGIVFMGGPMSVNDPLPWIEAECALIRDAVARGVPVLGHCLGGQLISRALGGTVTRNPVKEIGWSTVQAEENDTAARWLGPRAGDDAVIDRDGKAVVFQWHGETFSLPPGSERLFSNAECANQMFALGPHLGMQCHVEMTEAMIERWCESWPEEVAGLGENLPASVQTPAVMQAATPARLAAMRRLADRLYGQWLRGLVRD
ncbi:type 1 glutamine amidotransferase [Rhodocyclus tenuis]|uniref:GMP synthase-like glutamine amidotransferase n=1 Tax=Rhodocyclus tenuis TaxID=1066 RepID=A0A840G6R4_RHOTE|nr:type 1 glutamine amidotransferase [Rhodocyclus tenuis]MBB4248053.1 GMP synthase-like glutamine amidotransferase [Rhodocyclus tenuis]